MLSKDSQGRFLIPLQLFSQVTPWPRNPNPPASHTLRVVVSIEGGLQDASREDDLILGWKVVSVYSLRCHAPPGVGRRRLRLLTLLRLPSLTAQPCPACLLQGPIPPKPWSTSVAAPRLPTHSHWSRLGGLRSWSAITLAEKLYKFNMFWKKESSETSYCGNCGREKASENMLEQGRTPAGPS